MKNILKSLTRLNGIEYYVDLYPRLDPGHHEYLGESQDWTQAAAVLRQAAVSGSIGPDNAFEEYKRRGELKALKRLTPPAGFDLTAEYAEWQRRIQAKLDQVEQRAELCDREGIPCREEPTWSGHVRQLKESIERYAENPACQHATVEDCLRKIDNALVAEKARLLTRIEQVATDLEASRANISDRDFKAAKSHLDNARRCIVANDFVVGYRRLNQAESIVYEGEHASDTASEPQRLALPRRLSPGSSTANALRLVRDWAREYGDPPKPEVARFLPTAAIAAETVNSTKFIDLRCKSVKELRYFKALREWLGVRGEKCACRICRTS